MKTTPKLPYKRIYKYKINSLLYRFLNSNEETLFLYNRPLSIYEGKALFKIKKNTSDSLFTASDYPKSVYCIPMDAYYLASGSVDTYIGNVRTKHITRYAIFEEKWGRFQSAAFELGCLYLLKDWNEVLQCVLLEDLILLDNEDN